MNYGANGRLDLHFSLSNGQTVLRTLAQEPPLRVIRAFSGMDGAALVHLHNVSGGVLGGDQLEVQAEIAPHAQALLTTTGATRIYRQRGSGAVATQITQLRVGEGGLLEYLPDPLIPFAQARYHQATQVELAAGAGFFGWEIVAPGRVAHHELFQYDQLQLDLDIVACGRPIALERVCLEPSKRPLTSSVRLGNDRYFATFYACHTGWATQQWATLETQIDEMLRFVSPANTLWGVSTLVDHGLAVRGVGMNSRQLNEGLVRCWQVAKRALYGMKAVLPRKIY